MADVLNVRKIPFGLMGWISLMSMYRKILVLFPACSSGVIPRSEIGTVAILVEPELAGDKYHLCRW